MITTLDERTGKECVVFSTRHLGTTVEALESLWRSGEALPMGRDERRVTSIRPNDDGSTDYFLSGRWGPIAVRTFPPEFRYPSRGESSVVDPDPPAEPLEFRELTISSRFLDSLFRCASESGQAVDYKGARVVVEGGSRPSERRPTWFLRRVADGRKLVVRLDLGEAEPAPPPRLPDYLPTNDCDPLPAPAESVPSLGPYAPETVPAVGKRRQSSRKSSDQACFSFLD